MKPIQIRPLLNHSQQIDRGIFGSFIEHIENCIDGGILDLGNPLSDAKGIRQDVLALCRDLKPSILRFPGGTVVGIYHWQDHVGDIAGRKAVRNLIWGGMMPAEFGTCEFIEYCRAIGAEPMICINMPSGTPEEAANWVEYCNGTGHTYYADLRRSHGYEEPFNVRYWCIGNESYSVPDLGLQNDVKIYTTQAWEYAKYMKLTDPGIELVFVGNVCDDTWNRAVMDSLWEVCDYLSIHYYSSSSCALDRLDELNRSIIPNIEDLLAQYNSRTLSFDKWYRFPPRKHDTYIALDEWNIWDPVPDARSQYGIQQRYTWRDALWVAGFLNMLIRHSSSIRIANLAQLVNVLAPVIAEPEGAWKQTIYHPFSLYSNGCANAYVPCEQERFPQLDIALSASGNAGRLFIVNFGAQAVDIELPCKASAMWTLRSKSADLTSDRQADNVRSEYMPLANLQSVAIPAESVCMIEMPSMAQ